MNFTKCARIALPKTPLGDCFWQVVHQAKTNLKSKQKQPLLKKKRYSKQNWYSADPQHTTLRKKTSTQVFSSKS